MIGAIFWNGRKLAPEATIASLSGEQSPEASPKNTNRKNFDIIARACVPSVCLCSFLKENQPYTVLV